MANSKALRVVVVGAGIVGASIAYHLARRQVAVTVLERHRPGAGASSHSFAWINAFGKEPYPYHDLNRRSMEVWHRFAQGLQADVGLRWGGDLRWVHTAADAEALRQRIQHLQAWGYPNRLLSCGRTPTIGTWSRARDGQCRLPRSYRWPCRTRQSHCSLSPASARPGGGSAR